jgi:hypothetical protein
MFSMDYSFYRKLRTNGFGELALRKFQEFHGVRCWLELDNHDYPAPIYYVRGLLQNKGLPTKFEQGFWTGANSGFGALMMAVCLKANPINLLGYDFKHGPGGRDHFHNLYKGKLSAQQLSRFRKPFEMMAGPLAEKGIQVYNLNPDSGLRCFPFKTIEEALDGQTNNAPAAEPEAPAAIPDRILAGQGGALRAESAGPGPGPGSGGPEPGPNGSPASHSASSQEPGP